MSDWLDIDQMIALVSEMAEADGTPLNRVEAAAVCLQAIRNGEVPLYDPNGKLIEIPELAEAAFLDDMVARIRRKIRD